MNTVRKMTSRSANTNSLELPRSSCLPSLPKSSSPGSRIIIGSSRPSSRRMICLKWSLNCSENPNSCSAEKSQLSGTWKPLPFRKSFSRFIPSTPKPKKNKSGTIDSQQANKAKNQSKNTKNSLNSPSTSSIWSNSTTKSP